jgi:ABC-type dipeptide/oligopeptide/nickel transport system permease component
MRQYLGSRLWQSLLTVVGISTLLFFVLRLSGDPVTLLLPLDAPPEARQALRRDLGLDAPLGVQYLRFVSRLARLDFGESLRLRQSALDLVLARLPATLTLALTAMKIAIVCGLAAGILAAARPRNPLSSAVMLLSGLGQAMPVFWSGTLLLLVFAVHLRWLPAFGADDWHHLVLPAIALAGWPMARIARLTRVAMAEALEQDYIRTAYAKGIVERVIVFKHAAANTLISILTVIGVELGIMLGGAIVTETIFSWPGLGRQLMEAVLARDYPLVQATVFVVALMVLAINLLVDVAYAWADPRVRLA